MRDKEQLGKLKSKNVDLWKSGQHRDHIAS